MPEPAKPLPAVIYNHSIFWHTVRPQLVAAIRYYFPNSAQAGLTLCSFYIIWFYQVLNSFFLPVHFWRSLDFSPYLNKPLVWAHMAAGMWQICRHCRNHRVVTGETRRYIRYHREFIPVNARPPKKDIWYVNTTSPGLLGGRVWTPIGLNRPKALLINATAPLNSLW